MKWTSLSMLSKETNQFMLIKRPICWSLFQAEKMGQGESWFFLKIFYFTEHTKQMIKKWFGSQVEKIGQEIEKRSLQLLQHIKKCSSSFWLWVNWGTFSKLILCWRAEKLGVLKLAILIQSPAYPPWPWQRTDTFSVLQRKKTTSCTQLWRRL